MSQHIEVEVEEIAKPELTAPLVVVWQVAAEEGTGVVGGLYESRELAMEDAAWAYLEYGDQARRSCRMWWVSTGEEEWSLMAGARGEVGVGAFCTGVSVEPRVVLGRRI